MSRPRPNVTASSEEHRELEEAARNAVRLGSWLVRRAIRSAASEVDTVVGFFAPGAPKLVAMVDDFKNWR